MRAAADRLAHPRWIGSAARPPGVDRHPRGARAAARPRPVPRRVYRRHPRRAVVAPGRDVVRTLPRRAARAMLYLTIVGGGFLAWLILVTLFSPSIAYHIEVPIDPRSDHF